MKRHAAVLISLLLSISSPVFADDVSIDSNGNVTTGISNSNANLEVTGSDEDGILSTTSGTGKAAVYGGHSSGNYGLLGDDQHGVYGESASGEAGHFQGNATVTGDLNVGGTLNATVGNTDKVDGKHAADLLDKATYDTNADGKVNSAVTADTAVSASTAANSDKLDNKHASDLLDKATYDTNADGKVNSAASADDSDMVDGQHASDIISAAADEVRTPISACSTTISTSGSYYVTGNLSTTGHCITVTASNVTIDLMGFTLTGDGGSSDYGIYINNVSNVEVKNGTVTNFNVGIYAYNPGTANSNRAIDVRAISNTSHGIFFSSYNNLVRNCTAAFNTSLNGIYAASGSTITNNTSYSNGTNGIYTTAGSTVTNNTTYLNGNSGIYAGNGSTVTNNTTYLNGIYGISVVSSSTITNNTSYSNGNTGIYAYESSTLTNNTVRNNQQWGIYVFSSCRITGNTISSNNLSNTAGVGGLYVSSDNHVKDNALDGNFQNNIYIYGSDNAIEENLVTDSINGIYFSFSGNFYANNRASGNTTNYAGTLPSGGGDGGGNASF